MAKKLLDCCMKSIGVVRFLSIQHPPYTKSLWKPRTSSNGQTSPCNHPDMHTLWIDHADRGDFLQSTVHSSCWVTSTSSKLKIFRWTSIFLALSPSARLHRTHHRTESIDTSIFLFSTACLSTVHNTSGKQTGKLVGKGLLPIVKFQERSLPSGIFQ